MQINPDGLPIHADATAQIRSRIFLEGNFYVDLHPGTPNAPMLCSRRDAAGRQHLRPGAARPRPVRAQLQRARQPADAGAGLRRVARTAADRRRRTPPPGPERPRADRRPGAEPLAELLGRRVRGLVDRQPGAARHPAARPERVVAGQRGGVPRARLAAEPAAEPRHHLRRDDGGARRPPAGPERRRSRRCRRCCARPTARSPRWTPRSARRRRSPRRSCPGIKQLDPTIGRRCRGSRRPPRCSRRASSAALRRRPDAGRPGTPRARSSRPRRCCRASDTLARCFIHNLVPTGNEVIQDPPLRDRPARLPGAVPERRRDSPAPARTSTATAATCAPPPAAARPRCRPATLGTQGPLYGNAVLPPLGTRPAWPGQAPPLKRSAPCFQNAAPNLNSADHGERPVKRAITRPPPRLHRRRRCWSSLAIGDRRLHPRAPARVHLRPELLHGQAPSSRTPPRSPPARASRSRSPASRSGRSAASSSSTARRS